MITTRTREAYDGSWRIVLFDADDAGKLKAELGQSSFDANIDDYYVQRELEITRLQDSLLKNEISPLSIYMQLSRMTVEDAAARMRLRKSKVLEHLSVEGFKKVSVETLCRYARLFDIAVGDFFQFTHLDGDLSAETTRSPGGLVQRLRIFPRPAAVGDERSTPRGS